MSRKLQTSIEEHVSTEIQNIKPLLPLIVKVILVTKLTIATKKMTIATKKTDPNNIHKELTDH